MAEEYVVGVRKTDREAIRRAEEKAHPHKPPTNTKELLMDTKVEFLMGEMKSNKMIYVMKNDSISHAFQTLVENKISSVPIYNPAKHNFAGFLDYVDLVTLIVREVPEADLTRAGTSSSILSSGKLGQMHCDSVADLSKRNPYLPVEANAPLLRVIELMVRNRTQRIPVIDAENHLIGILTESGVLQFLHKNIKYIELAKKTVAELHLDHGRYVSINADHKAIDAFTLIRNEHVNGVAVLDAAGKLAGHISASDLKLVGPQANFLSALFLPAFYFIKLAGDQGPRPPVTVTPSSTLTEVIETFVSHRVHAIYVMDGEKLLGAITLADIVRVMHVLNQ